MVKAVNSKKTAFTLIEVVVIIILITILYSIAAPNYEKLLEKNKAESANFNLVSIYNAEKRYKLDSEENKYFICGAACDLTTLNEGLKLYMHDSNFTYGIVSSAAGGFSVIATRTGGKLCDGKKMTMTGASSDIVKECGVW